MTRSEDLFARARTVIPGGVDSPVRAFGGVGGTPVFFDRGEGAFLIDVDGNRYVDLVQSWGALLFGHARPEIVEAALRAAAKGTSFGTPTEGEVELAQRIVDAVPGVEQVRLVNSGTEAAMSAIRLARGATGRDLVVKFEGCYHGHSDSLLAKGRGQRTRHPGHPVVAGGHRRKREGHAHRPVQRSRGGAGHLRRAWWRGGRGGRRTRRGEHGRGPARAGIPRRVARAVHRARRAAAVRRGDHRVPDRLRRRAVLLRRDARPHGAREGDGRRVPVRGVRRARDAHGATGAHRPGLPGGHAEREPGGGGGRDRRARPGPHHRSVSRAGSDGRRPHRRDRGGVRGDRASP